MFADVEILSNNTYKFSKFTYSIPTSLIQKIKIGSIIKVTFRNNIKDAVVINTHNESPNIKLIKPIEKVTSQLNSPQLLFLKHVASANYLNIGMTLYNLYKDTDYKLDSELGLSENLIFNNNDIYSNLENKERNIIFTPSLKSAKTLYENMIRNNIQIDFYQKTGGNEEISNFIQSQSKHTNTILLSNNYPKIFQSKNTNCHFFDTNDIGFNLPKLNSMNIIELASLKQHYFGGRYYFYNEYPSLNIFDKATHYKKPDLTNVDIYHGNGITECIELLKTKYELSTNILAHDQPSEEFLNDFNIIKNNQEDYDISVLINPRIVYKNNLNSERLIYLIKKINEVNNKNKKLIILSTQNIDLHKALEYEYITKLTKEELKERKKWGPNLHHKVYKILSDTELSLENTNLVLGPRVRDDVFEYEININLRNNINYNEIITSFRKLQTYEPRKVTSI